MWFHIRSYFKMMDYVPGALRLNLFTCASKLRFEHDKEQIKKLKK